MGLGLPNNNRRQRAEVQARHGSSPPPPPPNTPHTPVQPPWLQHRCRPAQQPMQQAWSPWWPWCACVGWLRQRPSSQALLRCPCLPPSSSRPYHHHCPCLLLPLVLHGQRGALGLACGWDPPAPPPPAARACLLPYAPAPAAASAACAAAALAPRSRLPQHPGRAWRCEEGEEWGWGGCHLVLEGGDLRALLSIAPSARPRGPPVRPASHKPMRQLQPLGHPLNPRMQQQAPHCRKAPSFEALEAPRHHAPPPRALA